MTTVACLRKTIDRSQEDTLSDGEYFLIVHVCIFDHAGRLLIQQRHEAGRSAGWMLGSDCCWACTQWRIEPGSYYEGGARGDRTSC